MMMLRSLFLLLAGLSGCFGTVDAVPPDGLVEEAVSVAELDVSRWDDALSLHQSVSSYEVDTMSEGSLLADDSGVPRAIGLGYRREGDPTFVTSPTRGHFFMDTKLQPSGQPAIVDFELEWTTDYPVVRSVTLQSVAGTPRYTYEKRGEYYVRVPAGASPP